MSNSIENECNCVNTISVSDCNSNVNNSNIKFGGICDAYEIETFLTGQIWSSNNILGNIEVPDTMADIVSVYSVNAKFVNLKETVVETPAIYDSEGNVVRIITNYEDKMSTGRKLVVEGQIFFTIQYAASSPERSLNTFEDVVPFSSYLILPHTAKLTDKYVVLACIEDISVKELCPRSLSLSCLIGLKAELSHDNETGLSDSVVTLNQINSEKYFNCKSNIRTDTFSEEIVGSACSELNSIDVSGVCNEKAIRNMISEDELSGDLKEWTEVSIYSQIPIEAPYKDVKKILSVDSDVKILCQQVIETAKKDPAILTKVENSEGFTLTGRKLIIQGLLNQTITYIANNDCNSIHSLTFTTPFTNYIILNNVGNKLSLASVYNLSYCIEDVYIDAVKSRSIFQNTTLFIKATKASS